jgi:hypothetical protein
LIDTLHHHPTGFGRANSTRQPQMPSGVAPVVNFTSFNHTKADTKDTQQKFDLLASY